MYRKRPNLMIGFHGCDLKTSNRLVFNPQHIKISQSDYD
jgi:hypothetical protein